VCGAHLTQGHLKKLPLQPAVSHKKTRYLGRKGCTIYEPVDLLSFGPTPSYALVSNQNPSKSTDSFITLKKDLEAVNKKRRQQIGKNSRKEKWNDFFLAWEH
jgi:hypothetical protein